jgi:hypothetical protein
MIARKIPKQFEDIDDPVMLDMVMGVKDKLNRIVIYFIKKDHSHPMYYRTWGEALVMLQVNQLLHEVIDVLGIDPKAKSY